MYAKFYGLAATLPAHPGCPLLFRKHGSPTGDGLSGVRAASCRRVYHHHRGGRRRQDDPRRQSALDDRQSNFVIAKIVTTQLAGDDLLQLVAGGFGIAKEGLAKGSLLQRINDFVLAQQRNGRRVLLIVDEAQNLSFEALEELRMLSNIVVDRTMALQSFLLGQPQFRAISRQPAARTAAAAGNRGVSFGAVERRRDQGLCRASAAPRRLERRSAIRRGLFPLIYRIPAGCPGRSIPSAQGFCSSAFSRSCTRWQQLRRKGRQRPEGRDGGRARSANGAVLPAETARSPDPFSRTRNASSVLEDSVHRQGR